MTTPTENRKPVFFFAFANERVEAQRYLRDLPTEMRQIRESFRRAEQQGLCECIFRPNATREEIFEVFRDYRHRVVAFHYGGHANSFQLLLETREGKTAPTDAAGLADFLRQQRGLELVFLNGCSTQQQVERLLEANIPMVVATSQAIDDRVAMTLAAEFYAGLASGATIHGAFAEAVAGVKSEKGDNVRDLYWEGIQDKHDGYTEDRLPWELYIKPGAETAAQWNLPGAVGDPLFSLPVLQPGELPDKPFRHLGWFAREHAEIFFGREHQIRKLYDRVVELNTSPIILLYGQSGVGKSSLLAAGLLPRLEESYDVYYLRRNHEAGLASTLRQAFAPAGSDAPLGAC